MACALQLGHAPRSLLHAEYHRLQQLHLMHQPRDIDSLSNQPDLEIEMSPREDFKITYIAINKD